MVCGDGNRNQSHHAEPVLRAPSPTEIQTGVKNSSWNVAVFRFTKVHVNGAHTHTVIECAKSNSLVAGSGTAGKNTLLTIESGVLIHRATLWQSPRGLVKLDLLHSTSRLTVPTTGRCLFLNGRDRQVCNSLQIKNSAADTLSLQIGAEEYVLCPTKKVS